MVKDIADVISICLRGYYYKLTTLSYGLATSSFCSAKRVYDQVRICLFSHVLFLLRYL